MKCNTCSDALSDRENESNFLDGGNWCSDALTDKESDSKLL